MPTSCTKSNFGLGTKQMSWDTGKSYTMASPPVQEVFHVYLNKFEMTVSHLFLIIFSNNKGPLTL